MKSSVKKDLDTLSKNLYLESPDLWKIIPAEAHPYNCEQTCLVRTRAQDTTSASGWR